MKQALDIGETVLNATGIVFAVQDIESILSIVLLVVSILSLLIRGGYMAYKYFKNKEVDKGIKEVVDTLDKTQTTLEEYKNNKENKK